MDSTQRPEGVGAGGWRSLGRVSAFCRAVSPGLTALVLVSAVAGGVAHAVNSIATGLLVGAVPLAAQTAGPAGIDNLVRLALFMVAATAVNGLTDVGVQLLPQALAVRAGLRMRERVLQTTLATPGIAHLE